jgi:hypothetical protein
MGGNLRLGRLKPRLTRYSRFIKLGKETKQSVEILEKLDEEHKMVKAQLAEAQKEMKLLDEEELRYSELIQLLERFEPIGSQPFSTPRGASQF